MEMEKEISTDIKIWKEEEKEEAKEEEIEE